MQAFKITGLIAGMLLLLGLGIKGVELSSVPDHLEIPMKIVMVCLFALIVKSEFDHYQSPALETLRTASSAAIIYAVFASIAFFDMFFGIINLPIVNEEANAIFMTMGVVLTAGFYLLRETKLEKGKQHG